MTQFLTFADFPAKLKIFSAWKKETKKFSDLENLFFPGYFPTCERHVMKHAFPPNPVPLRILVILAMLSRYLHTPPLITKNLQKRNFQDNSYSLGVKLFQIVTCKTKYQIMNKIIYCLKTNSLITALMNIKNDDVSEKNSRICPWLVAG